MELELSHTINDQTLSVKVVGRLAIDTAADLAGLLREQMPAVQKVQLDVSELSATDFTGIQVVCSACKTALTKGQGFGFYNPLNQTLKKHVEEVGLQAGIKCRHSAGQLCIWHGVAMVC